MALEHWSFGNQGLSCLLPAGLTRADERGMTLVVRGRPGAGKTVFCLDVAIGSFLLQGGHLAIFDLEQGEAQTKYLLDSLLAGWHLREPTLPAWQGVDARVHLVDARVTSKMALMAQIQELVGAWAAPSSGVNRDRTLFVIDSVNAIDDSIFTRGQFDGGVRSEVTRKGFWLMVTCESGLGVHEDLPWLDYIADVSLALGFEEHHGYSSRAVELVKCRASEHVRGKQSFVIESESGPARSERYPDLTPLRVITYPSLAAKLAGWRQQALLREGTRTGRMGAASQETVSLGVAGLNYMVGEGGVARASSTAYVGTRACRKTPCALHFAMPPKGSPQSRTLLVSLGMDESALASVVSDYRELAQHLLNPRDGTRLNRSVVEPYLVRPGYMSPEKLVSELERRLEEASFEKVIVTDLAQLSSGFPRLARAPVLLSSLVQMFRDKEVTALFVDTVPMAAATGSAVESEIALLVDNVIEFRHLFFYGSDHLGVVVRRRHGAQHESNFREIKGEWTDTIIRGVRRRRQVLRLEKSLEGFTGLFSDAPHLSPLSLLLFEANCTQKAINDQIVEVARTAFPALGEQVSQVRFHPHDSSFRLYSLELSAKVPQPDIRVAMLDEFWVNRLEPHLAPMPEDVSGELPADRLLQGLGAAARRELRAERRWHPHFVNVGVLASLELRLPQEIEDALDPADSSWGKLANLIEEAGGQLPSWLRGRPLFGFDDRSPESWTSTVLEIICGAGGLEGQSGRLNLSSEAAVAALADFCFLYWQGRNAQQRVEPVVAAYARTRTYQSDPLAFEGGTPLLFRCWYSDLVAFLQSHNTEAVAESSSGESARPDRARIFRIPGGRSVRGDWNWGVIAASTTAGLGWRLIATMCSPDMAARKYEWGIGLPAEASFYEPGAKHFSVDPRRPLSWVRDEVLASAVLRKDVKGYLKIAPTLQRFLLEALLIGAHPRAKLRCRVGELAALVQAQVDQVQVPAAPDETVAEDLTDPALD